MAILKQFLDALGVLWFHCPNEGKRSFYVGRIMKAHGMKRGVPDALVFERWVDRNPLKGGLDWASGHGIAVELKSKRRGALPTPEQLRWLDALSLRGWKTTVAFGADEAMAFVNRYLCRVHPRVEL